jgi:hypothetical protein
MRHVVEPGRLASFPEGQLVQDEDSSTALYVPTLQLVHDAARLDEYVPAAQMVQFVDSPGEKEPGEQSPHVVAFDFDPVAEPLLHSRHPSFSAIEVNLPASHSCKTQDMNRNNKTSTRPQEWAHPVHGPT